jgi:thiol:disulfide interchange protein DsbD
MKKHFLFILAMLFAGYFTVTGQVLQPVKWAFDTKQINSGEYEVIFKASIDPGWHVYGIDIPEGGPIPTSFKFKESPDYELVGQIKTPKPIEKYDNAFEMDLRYFEDGAIFRQTVKMKSNKPFQVTGELEYMACDDHRCLPPEYVEFAFNLPGVTAAPADEKATEVVETQPVPQPIKQEDVQENPAQTTAIQADTTSANATGTSAEAAEPTAPAKTESSLWAFFFLALGVGFIGLLTPCVYPMIPMTVTFFMNASQNKMKARAQALFFGISIIFIYTVIGVLVSAIFGADTIKQVSEHWITNIIFFLLFATFAASFFGMFEMVLPAWLTNKSDQQVDKGGYVGSFFMALTLVLVSFSCTAPFVGGILVEAATGEVVKPIVGMFGFSLAFGVVFTFLAFFPALLNKMPRSGGWLNSVKVVLAFLILAIGMKYLLVPNQALGWGISREVYIAVWIVLFVLLGMYLLGKIQFSHDSPVNHVSVPRLLMVILSFTFALYLFPGMFGAPLKAVSGYLPTESSWDLDDIIRESTRNISVSSTGTATPAGLCDAPKYADRFTLPHGLQGYFDYEQGMACAKKLNKPVFLDIKGHACTNCKVMEKNVWSDPEVLKRLENDFVIIALYVDDTYELPESEWVTSTFDGKVKKTIGRKNTDFQITRFGVNAQPYYVILDHNGKELNTPVAFEPNANNYVKFLDEGIAAFNKGKQ